MRSQLRQSLAHPPKKAFVHSLTRRRQFHSLRQRGPQRQGRAETDAMQTDERSTFCPSGAQGKQRKSDRRPEPLTLTHKPGSCVNHLSCLPLVLKLSSPLFLSFFTGTRRTTTITAPISSDHTSHARLASLCEFRISLSAATVRIGASRGSGSGGQARCFYLAHLPVSWSSTSHSLAAHFFALPSAHLQS